MLRPGSLHFTRGADMLRSGFLEFTLEHSPTKYLVVGDVVSSDEFSAGGYSWRIVCYPHGNERGNADYLSIFLEIVSESEDKIKAIFDVFLMGRDGKPSDSDACWCAPEDRPRWGFPQFVKRRDLAPIYAANGRVTMVCGVIVLCSYPKPVPPPPSDIGFHLGRLLDSAMGADVTFMVNGEAFPAHRAVLAARSPVFEAQLLGSMADATMPVITVEEIDPAVFGVLLRFVYTDFFPEHEELGGSPTDMLQHLIAAADRYALDRLKIMCSQNLREKVSVDTVSSILACAEAYNCSELKQKCLDFIAVEKILKESVSRMVL
ncbi:unnamed protein product [Urochloa decumbens]|uniref:Uncharacterized protein n=1 Tax=Urochloa decumbens TaxID=240449 RepID=A0ABC9C8I4_9POAL